MTRRNFFANGTTALAAGAIPASAAEPAANRPEVPPTNTRRVQADGINVFYREAGPADAPVILLLHGFPTSSFQYRELIPRLADRYRVIAPDLPGFGFTEVPAERGYTYSFDNLAKTSRSTSASRSRRYWRSGGDLIHSLSRRARKGSSEITRMPQYSFSIPAILREKMEIASKAGGSYETN